MSTPYLRLIQENGVPATAIVIDFTAIAVVYKAGRTITLKSGDVIHWSEEPATAAWWTEFMMVLGEYQRDMQQRERMGA